MTENTRKPKKERHPDDFYATDGAAAVPPLLVFLGWLGGGKMIWENSCGMGHISKELLRVGHAVLSTDLIDRGYGVGGVDFLKPTYYQNVMDFDAIIMNPPYKNRLARQFVELSLERVRTGAVVAALLNIRFLESKDRKKLFAKSPPKYVCVFSSRIKCALNGDFENCGDGVTCYAWFIWEKGYKGEPIVKWL